MTYDEYRDFKTKINKEDIYRTIAVIVSAGVLVLMGLSIETVMLIALMIVTVVWVRTSSNMKYLSRLFFKDNERAIQRKFNRSQVLRNVEIVLFIVAFLSILLITVEVIPMILYAIAILLQAFNSVYEETILI